LTYVYPGGTYGMAETEKTRPGDPHTSPEAFLAALETQPEGWSEDFGGPEGVARLMTEHQQRLGEQSARLAEVRNSAVTEMLKTRSGAEVARTFGLSRSLISKLATGSKWEDARW
jgi:hypothetical protein